MNRMREKLQDTSGSLFDTFSLKQEVIGLLVLLLVIALGAVCFIGFDEYDQKQPVSVSSYSVVQPYAADAIKMDNSSPKTTETEKLEKIVGYTLLFNNKNTTMTKKELRIQSQKCAHFLIHRLSPTNKESHLDNDNIVSALQAYGCNQKTIVSIVKQL